MLHLSFVSFALYYALPVFITLMLIARRRELTPLGRSLVEREPACIPALFLGRIDLFGYLCHPTFVGNYSCA